MVNFVTAYNLVRDDHGQVSLVLRDRRRDLAANTMQEYIGAGAIEPQPAQLHVFEEARQRRTIQADLAGCMVQSRITPGLSGVTISWDKSTVPSREWLRRLEEEIIAFCKDQLGSTKTPKTVEFWPELPRSAVGKILKKDIRAKFWGDNWRAV